MNNANAHIYYHNKPEAILKITGSLRFNQCAALEHFLKVCLPLRVPQNLLVDLRETEMLDSTALGLLAQIALQTEKLTHQKPSLYCENNDLQKILLSMSLDQLFQFLSSAPVLPESIPELTSCGPAETQDNQTARALHAHTTLMQLSEKNKKEFKTVVDLLKESMRRS